MPQPLTVGNPPRDYSHLAREDPLCVYVIVNGTLAMGPGKLASQAFQAALWMCTDSQLGPEWHTEIARWQEEGARTVVRVAETPTVWERICVEAPGLVLEDEGLTEVERGARTVFVSWPLRRSQAPKIFSHKRVPLL